ncbi:unnamed protein product [Boreogadus saida]
MFLFGSEQGGIDEGHHGSGFLSRAAKEERREHCGATPPFSVSQQRPCSTNDPRAPSFDSEDGPLAVSQT